MISANLSRTQKSSASVRDLGRSKDLDSSIRPAASLGMTEFGAEREKINLDKQAHHLYDQRKYK